MLKFFACLYFLTTFCISANAQQSSPEYLFKFRSGGGFGKFFIIATAKGNDLKVVYSTRDNVSSKWGKDPSFKSIMDSLLYGDKKISNSGREYALRKMTLLVNTYSTFTKDSLQVNLNDHKELLNLLLQVDLASNEELGSKHRIVLDGSLHVFEFSGPHGTKWIEESSPTVESHPILMQVVAELLKLR